jgi:hypothetical protein
MMKPPMLRVWPALLVQQQCVSQLTDYKRSRLHAAPRSMQCISQGTTSIQDDCGWLHGALERSHTPQSCADGSTEPSLL